MNSFMNQKLEALELHGYKTFASKTAFLFPDKITAVVGPNGSGKSNIADSIRWVLGEQAYSVLRGKKTEDMIYSGSAQRSKMSMASATIRFNNDNGWLPIDFEQVSITRRAYRNGENEYLINEKKVRLRDIQELLANSGLAERTYTIIGQGLVDSALSLKPQDRRLFFEEAAGIRLYRARREEAIRKLDKTVDNMDRVRDILHEIHPRMVRLEKQVERAKEYNRINADLQLLLKDWYGFRWNILQQDYRTSLDAKVKKESELNSIRSEVANGDEAVADSRKILQEKREELSILNGQLAELQGEKEKINRELAISEERFKGYEEQRDSLKSSLAYSEEELATRLEQKEEIDRQFDEYENSLEKSKAEMDALEIALNEKKSELQAIRSQIESKQRAKLEMDKIIAGDQAKSSDLDSRVDILIKRRTELDETMKLQEENLQEINNEVDQFQSFYDEQVKLKEQEDKTYQAWLAQKTTLENELRDLNQKLQKNHNDLTARETQLNVLENAKKNLEGFKTGTKKILQTAQQKNLPGNFELLLSCMRVENGYEKAIAALLGDTAEGLILDQSMQLNSILALIQGGGDAHSILLPKALIKENGVKKSAPISGCRPILEFVRSTPEYQPILNVLLTDTYVLENENELEIVLSKMTSQQKIVLKDGGIFYGNGVISIGGTNSEFIFKRENEIEDLRHAMEDLQEKSSAFEKEAQLLKKTGQELDEKISISKERIMELGKEEKTILSGLRNIQNKYSNATQDIRLNKELVAKLLLDIQEAMEARNFIKQGLKDAQIRAENLQGELELLQHQEAAISMDDLNRDFYQKKTEYAVIQESFLGSKNRLQDSERLISSLQTQCDEIKNKLDQLEKQHSELLQRYDNDSERAKIFNDQIVDLQGKIKPIEDTISAINAEIEKQLNDIENLRKNQSIIERHFIQLEMRVDKVKNQMDTLKERISDDFGLVSYDYQPEVSGPKPLPIDGMVANLPKITQVPDDLEDQIKTLKTSIRRMGSVNPEAEKEYSEESERYAFLTSQIADLEQAEKDLRKVVVELEDIIKVKFSETFKAVNAEFSEIFKQLFGGGSAKLVIEDEENITETGIEIEATLPGKRKQELALLSGGERSLTAIALIFSLLKISPTPFCVLDEVDAMLDESNVVRLGQLMQELSDRTQFIVITHNRNTVQLANVIYGVTMGRDSASQVISLQLEEVTEEMVE